jgi:methylenetetrahydrofolate reductase (NADPH)
MKSAAALVQYKPQFFSVTFGAGGSTREGTRKVVTLLREQTGVDVAPHISCIGSSAEDLMSIIHEYKTMGIKRLVVLRGDLPSGMVNAGEFKYASELVQLIRYETGDHFNIYVAAYPEFHPHAKNARDDLLNLKRKYESGANAAITQYFFNPDAYFYFLDDCVRLGIDMPIIPGVMPITQFSRLARFSDACGAEIPRWLRKRLEECGDDIDAIQRYSAEYITDLCEKLLIGGAPSLHFYTLNKSDPVAAIYKRLHSEKSNKLYKQVQSK